jgi:hypothetical protein
MDRPSFFISFEPVLPERALKPASGGLPEWGGQVAQKPLVVRVLIVQNDRVPPLLTHRATTANRAEIGRLCRPLESWPDWSSPER